LYRLELAAVGLTDDVRLPRGDRDDNAELPEPRATRDVWFDDQAGPASTPVYHRDDLPAGVQFVGPAVIDQLDSTTVVPPGVLAEIDENLNMRLHITEAS
jgi:N-methylhydantoinase A